MHISQLIIITIILIIIFKTVRSCIKNKLSIIFSTFWIAFWIIGIFFVLNLSFLSNLAKLMGIGRGADLVLYLSIILLFYFIYSISLQIADTNVKITKIVRELALREKEIKLSNKKN